jgi:hypothetical protein
MTVTADTLRLVDSIVRLRRAERVRRAAPDVAPVRRQLESQLGPTLSRSRASKIFGVSQTARRSLAYHRAIAERLDDSLVAEARDRVDRLATEGHMHPTYAKRWREALALPVADLAAAIAADTQDARDLHQSSPFAGVLNEYERRRII